MAAGKCFWIGAGLVQLVILQQVALAVPDGINIYKDILRVKNDEDDYAAMLSAEDFDEPKLVFYRTPLDSFADVSMNGYDKRTVNRYKNMMLNKDAPDALLVDDPLLQGKDASSRMYFPRVSTKRNPGAILSWAIPAANRVRVFNTNYRPPGINRPAA
uniref:Putative conserved secreted protein n=1 Tax=Culex tarsalis TaxID=7177 RepID=A0A1Q3G5B7_CULTA